MPYKHIAADPRTGDERPRVLCGWSSADLKTLFIRSDGLLLRASKPLWNAKRYSFKDCLPG